VSNVGRNDRTLAKRCSSSRNCLFSGAKNDGTKLDNHVGTAKLNGGTGSDATNGAVRSSSSLTRFEGKSVAEIVNVATG